MVVRSSGYEGQVVGRRTLKEAESSREDEAAVRKHAVDGGRRKTAGPGRNAEVLAEAGNPMSPQSGRIQDSEGHRTSTRGSTERGDPGGAATGGPTSEREWAQGGPSGRRARSSAKPATRPSGRGLCSFYRAERNADAC